MDNENTTQETQATQATTQNAESSTVKTAVNVSPDEIAKSLMAALDSRQKRVEAGVAKSMAEQYGMSDDEIAQILQAEKAKRAAQLPPEQQKIIDDQISKANNLLIAAEVKAIGSSMGLVDPDAALLLMDRDSIKVDDNGTVTGAKESLESLKSSKPYLFGTSGAWGERHGSSAPDKNGVEKAFAEMNPKLKL